MPNSSCGLASADCATASLEIAAGGDSCEKAGAANANQTAIGSSCLKRDEEAIRSLVLRPWALVRPWSLASLVRPSALVLSPSSLVLSPGFLVLRVIVRDQAPRTRDD